MFPVRPPDRFKKVVLPATSRTRLTAAAIGEGVDTNSGFRTEDEEARARLDAALRRDGVGKWGRG